jgi:YggT family protein
MLILVQVVRVAFEVLNWLIIARVLLSWIRHNPYHPVIRFVYEITEPVLSPFRRLMPKGMLPVDLSPIFALLVLRLVERLVISILFTLI